MTPAPEQPQRADRLIDHYAPSEAGEAGETLIARILAALAAAGLNSATLRPADLAPLDQFHSRGREATLDLARRAGLSPGQRILDLGGGLGGAARTLAAEHNGSVVVLDLTPAYCQAGEALTRLTHLNDRVTFRVGDALELSEPEATYDLVWSQHSTMNIADKARLYGQAWRVLRPGGRLALHEIASGPGGPVIMPVPWASAPADSHLLPAADLRAIIAEAGFRELVWEDESALALAAFQAQLNSLKARGGQLPALGLHVVLGASFLPMLANLARNLEERRIAIVQAVFDR